jgi:hypothetical protein
MASRRGSGSPLNARVMEEKSGMCVRLAAGNLRSGVFFLRRLGSIRYL